jgi:hypothetical protein
MKAYAIIYPLQQPPEVEAALAGDNQVSFNHLLDWLGTIHQCIGSDGDKESGMLLFQTIDDRNAFNHDLINACQERNLPFLFMPVEKPVNYRVKQKKKSAN